MAKPARDGFLLGPLALGALSPVALGFAAVHFDDLAILMALLLVPILIVAGLVVVVDAIRRAFGRRWRAASSELLLGALLLGFALAPQQLFEPIARLGTEAGRISYYASLWPEILLTPSDGGPRFLVFDRGGFAGINNFAIYDESDEIGLAPDVRSAAWQARHASDARLCGGPAWHVIGHFYECSS